MAQTRGEFLAELAIERQRSNSLLKKLGYGYKKQKHPKKKVKRVKRQPKERFIYCLELEGGNYYVGQTTDVKSRFKSHSIGRGALWTKLHKPIRVIESYSVGNMTESMAVDEEDKLVDIYISKYNNTVVRGGRHCSIRSY